MKHSFYVLFAIICVSLVGCTKRGRSISNSGYADHSLGAYTGDSEKGPHSDAAFKYRGELSEFDVLGITPGENASEAEIQRALDNAKRIKLHQGSSLLVIQSGATFPDAPMVAELEKHFRVVTFSGVPPASPGVSPAGVSESPDAQNYSRSLRLAAARGGNEIIVCYWGMLESETENLPTKTVSWVPVVNWMAPDEKQNMRIRIKMALIDVRTGDWTVFSPRAFANNRISTSPTRSASDQKQVERLKQQAYMESAQELVRLYSDLASGS
jgi:hypothetical protein